MIDLCCSDQTGTVVVGLWSRINGSVNEKKAYPVTDERELSSPEPFLFMSVLNLLKVKGSR